jgi:hypothetical protein
MRNMKSLSVIVIIVCLVCRLQAYEGKVTVHVTDEAGGAVSNAAVVAQFENALKPGEGWGTGRPTEVKGHTDAEGVCALTGDGTDGSVGIGVMRADYYGNSTEVLFTNADSALNRWLPWNPVVEVVLKKKGIQVPMYARQVNRLAFPIQGKPVGFDLMAGDWVAPYGKGETPDFVFKFESKPEPEVPPREIRPFDVTLTVSFSNDGDGIQSVYAPRRSSSELRLPREAPLEGYEPTLIKHQETKRGQVPHIEFREDQNYFFRVRTKKDAQGNTVSALYGKIDGDFNQEDGGFLARGWLSFIYYLNPEPNSRDMEFDWRRNLSKNLRFMEEVHAP